LKRLIFRLARFNFGVEQRHFRAIEWLYLSFILERTGKQTMVAFVG
jgi:hypothetical protein